MRKFTLFLAALCCCTMMANATNYSLQVAGVQVTDANCSDILNDGKVSYDDATKTLTLNNASIAPTIAFAPSKTKGCSIRPVREVAAPQGIDEINHNSEIINHKFIKDGQLLIERDGKIYNAQGANVK